MLFAEGYGIADRPRAVGNDDQLLPVFDDLQQRFEFRVRRLDRSGLFGAAVVAGRFEPVFDFGDVLFVFLAGLAERRPGFLALGTSRAVPWHVNRGPDQNHPGGWIDQHFLPGPAGQIHQGGLAGDDRRIGSATGRAARGHQHVRDAVGARHRYVFALRVNGDRRLQLRIEFAFLIDIVGRPHGAHLGEPHIAEGVEHSGVDVQPLGVDDLGAARHADLASHPCDTAALHQDRAVFDRLAGERMHGRPANGVNLAACIVLGAGRNRQGAPQQGERHSPHRQPP